ncbi:MAG: hypothetical protein LBH44_10005 [Treponema sp.]|jgi:hypothetical protein|nr:hypothetical protein [Treponema sp.]
MPLKSKTIQYALIPLLAAAVIFSACDSPMGFGDVIDLEPPVLKVTFIVLPDGSKIPIQSDEDNKLFIGPGILVGPGFTLQGEAYDNVQVTEVKVDGKLGSKSQSWNKANVGRRSGNNWQTWSIVLDGIEKGEWVLRITALDRPGNIGPQTVKELTLIVDTDPPIVESIKIERAPGVFADLLPRNRLQSMNANLFAHVDYFQNEQFVIRAEINHDYMLDEIRLNLLDGDTKLFGNDGLEREAGTSLYSPAWEITQAMLLAANPKYASGKHYLRVLVTAKARAGHSGQNEDVSNLLYNLCWYPESDFPRIPDLTVHFENGAYRIEKDSLLQVNAFDDDNVGEAYVAMIAESSWNTVSGANDEAKLQWFQNETNRYNFSEGGEYPLRDNKITSPLNNATIPVNTVSDRGNYKLAVLVRDIKDDPVNRPALWSHRVFNILVVEEGIPDITVTAPAENSSPALTGGNTFTLSGYVLNLDDVNFVRIAWIPAGAFADADAQVAAGKTALKGSATGVLPNGIQIWHHNLSPGTSEEIIPGKFYQKQTFSRNINIFNDLRFNNQPDNRDKLFVLYTQGLGGDDVFTLFRLHAYTRSPVITINTPTDYQPFGPGANVPFDITVAPEYGLAVGTVRLETESGSNIPLTRVGTTNRWTAAWTTPVAEYIYGFRVIATDTLGNADEQMRFIDVTTHSQLRHITANHNDNTLFSEGKTITIQAVFSKSVNVTGNPEIVLSGLNSTRYADYKSGTGSATLNFEYTPAAGDLTAGTNVLSATAIRLNSGTIDAENFGGDFSLTSAQAKPLADKALKVDAVAPVIRNISIPGPTDTTGPTEDSRYAGDQAYRPWLKAGNNLVIRVRADKSLRVLGTPQLILPFNNRRANFLRTEKTGSEDNDTMVFTYIVQTGDQNGTTPAYDSFVSIDMATCISVTDLSSITDIAGNILKAGSGSSASGVKIDAVLPSALTVSNAGSFPGYTLGGTLQVGNFQIVDTNTKPDRRMVQYSLKGGTDGWTDVPAAATFPYTIPSITADGTYHVQARQIDRAGNISPASADVRFTVESPFVAVLKEVTSPHPKDTKFSGRDTVTINAVFEKPVTVTSGTPQIALAGTGGATRYATLVAGSGSGSGSTTLNFTYTPVSGDFTADKITATLFELNNAVISGLDNDIALSSTGNAKALADKVLKVDAVAPVIDLITIPAYSGEAQYSPWVRAGYVFEIKVRANKSLRVLGSPVLNLPFNSRTASFLRTETGVNDNDTMVFTYTVQNNDLHITNVAINRSNCIPVLTSITDVVGAGNILTYGANTNDSAAGVGIQVDAVKPDAPTLQDNGSTPGGYALNKQLVAGNFRILGTSLELSRVRTEYTQNGGATWTPVPNGPPQNQNNIDIPVINTAGTYNVQARQVDRAGNVSDASAQMTFTIVPPFTAALKEVTSPHPANTMFSGNNDPVTINAVFDKSVTVTGTPRIALEGMGTQYAAYTGGGGSTTLSFTYTPTSPDFTSDRITATSLELNGGTISGIGGNITLSSLAGGNARSLYDKALKVDAVAPVIDLITIPAYTGDYAPWVRAGYVFEIKVRANKPLRVLGSPVLNLPFNSGNRTASFLRTENNDTMVFTYTVQNGDLHEADVAINRLNCIPDLSSITDTAGAGNVLTYGASANYTGNIRVDAVAPGAPTVQDNGSSPVYTVNGTLQTGNFRILGSSLELTRVRTEYTLNGGATWTSVPNGPPQTQNNIDIPVIADAGTKNVQARQVDRAGNVGAVSNPMTFTIVPPFTAALKEVTSPHPANTTFSGRDTVTINAVFDKSVTVTETGGTPRIALTGMGSTQYAAYTGGTGSTTLSFTYTPDANDFTSDRITATALELNGGTISGISGNITLSSTGNAKALSDKALKVDAVAPVIQDISIPFTGEAAYDPWFRAGNEMQIRVQTSKPMRVLGVPKLKLPFNNREASFLRTDKTNVDNDTLVFTYTVVSGDQNGLPGTTPPYNDNVIINRADCITVADLSIITDRAGSQGNLLSLDADSSDTEVKVDAVDPPQLTVQDNNSTPAYTANGTLRLGRFQITSTNQEIDRKRIQYTTDGGANWTNVENPSPHNTNPISIPDITAAGMYNVQARQVDRAGNVGVTSVPRTFTISGPLRLETLSCDNPDRAYPLGSTLTFKLAFNEKVYTAGQVSVTLAGGSGDVNTDYDVPITQVIKDNADFFLIGSWQNIPAGRIMDPVTVKSINGLNNVRRSSDDAPPDQSNLAAVVSAYSRPNLKVISKRPVIESWVMNNATNNKTETAVNNTAPITPNNNTVLFPEGTKSILRLKFSHKVWAESGAYTITVKPAGDWYIPPVMTGDEYYKVTSAAGLLTTDIPDLNKNYQKTTHGLKQVGTNYVPDTETKYVLNFTTGISGNTGTVDELRAIFNRAKFRQQEIEVTGAQIKANGNLSMANGAEIVEVHLDRLLDGRQWKIEIASGSFRDEAGNTFDAAAVNNAWNTGSNRSFWSANTSVPVIRVERVSNNKAADGIVTNYIASTNNNTGVAASVPNLNTYADKYSSITSVMPISQTVDLGTNGTNANGDAILQTKVRYRIDCETPDASISYAVLGGGTAVVPNNTARGTLYDNGNYRASASVALNIGNSNIADVAAGTLNALTVGTSYTAESYLNIGGAGSLYDVSELYTARKDYIAATAIRNTAPNLTGSARGFEGAFKTVIVFRTPFQNASFNAQGGTNGNGTDNWGSDYGTQASSNKLYYKLEASNNNNGAVTVSGFPLAYNDLTGKKNKYMYRVPDNSVAGSQVNDDRVWISWEIVCDFWAVPMRMFRATPNSPFLGGDEDAWTNHSGGDWHQYHYRKYGNYGVRHF